MEKRPAGRILRAKRRAVGIIYHEAHLTDSVEGQGKAGNMKKKRQNSYDPAKVRALQRELRGYEREGTQLFLNGRPCMTEDIVNACMFAEEQSYMRDFISDEKEKIQRINFVKVDQR